MRIRTKHFLVATIATTLAIIGIGTGIAYGAGTNELVQGTTNGSVYKAGSTVTINGTVNGDVFCAGQTVAINATVNGDVLCVGQDVSVLGRINGSVRLGGQTVDLGATVTRSASVAGQSIVIENGSSVGLDLTIVAQTATVNGTVRRDIAGAVSTATLGSYVGRNVSLHTDNLTVGGRANIVGDVTYTSPHRLQQLAGSHMQGAVTYTKSQPRHHGIGGFIWAALYWTVAMVVLGVVLVALFPKVFRDLSLKWGSDFWWALLTGFVAMFAVPAVILALMLTIVGAPLGIIVLLSWIVAAFIAMVIASYFIGGLIAPHLHPVLIVLIGSVVLGVIALIPILGWMICLIAYWVGSGVLLKEVKRYHPWLMYEKT